jgi:hypothetical protein
MQREIDSHFNNFIPLFYRQSFISQMLYGFVSAYRSQGLKVHDALLAFQNFIGGAENTLSIESLHMAYYRCLNETRAINKQLPLPDEEFVEVIKKNYLKQIERETKTKQQQTCLF